MLVGQVETGPWAPIDSAISKTTIAPGHSQMPFMIILLPLTISSS